jgi:hypothetical protein
VSDEGKKGKKEEERKEGKGNQATQTAAYSGAWHISVNFISRVTVQTCVRPFLSVREREIERVTGSWFIVHCTKDMMTMQWAEGLRASLQAKGMANWKKGFFVLTGKQKKSFDGGLVCPCPQANKQAKP